MPKSQRSLPGWLQQWWVWFAAIFILTFISFWPSFFSAIVNIETHIIIHGISAISWMLLAVIQAWLIKSRWRKHHRTLGYASLVIAFILVLSGLRVLQTMLLKDYSVDGSNPLLAIKFLYADITALFLFCTFLWLAIGAARRRDFSLHMRLMACTAIIPWKPHWRGHIFMELPVLSQISMSLFIHQLLRLSCLWSYWLE